MSLEQTPLSVAQAYLRRLAEHGIEYLFANAGTDFAPIIEAYATADIDGLKYPEPVVVPHENVAVAMAHGYYLMTGRPQAVMVHVNVGTANALCGIINAYKDNIPIFMTAGRTPLTENELSGSRDGPIHWAQEMFDQASMVRENVKWDYELRNGAQVEAVVDRAMEIAMTEPRGPIYLSLPREVLGEMMPTDQMGPVERRAPATAPGALSSAIDQAADMIAAAKSPLVLTRRVGRDPEAAASLASLAEKFALPVAEFRPIVNSLASDHPMNVGMNIRPRMEAADLVLALDTDAPWLPNFHGEPGPDCKVIQMGIDPLEQTYPIRSFPRDLAITGALGPALAQLQSALESRLGSNNTDVEARRNLIAEQQTQKEEQLATLRDRVKVESPIHSAFATHQISQAAGEDAIFVNDYPMMLPHLTVKESGQYIGTPLAGGLGWATGAAIGAKMANPDKMVVCAMGDGSYMFANPIAAHQVCKARDLPILFVIFNNAQWFAVKRATMAMYPEGRAVKANEMPLTSLSPSPDFENMMTLYGGHGERVENPDELAGALERAVNAVKNEGRQALVHIVCQAVQPQP